MLTSGACTEDEAAQRLLRMLTQQPREYTPSSSLATPHTLPPTATCAKSGPPPTAHSGTSGRGSSKPLTAALLGSLMEGHIVNAVVKNLGTKVHSQINAPLVQSVRHQRLASTPGD